jgi:hypothetical protein
MMIGRRLWTEMGPLKCGAELKALKEFNNYYLNAIQFMIT